MKNSKKSIINKYYNETYDIDLIVANKYATLEQLKKKYTYFDGVILDDAVTNGSACAAKCRDIKTNKYCILVKFNKDFKDESINWFINTITHESVHVSLYIYELIEQQVCFDSSEPLCYLTGWISECMYKTVIK